MVNHPRVSLEVNNDLIKNVEKHLKGKNILPNCDLYGIAGISCISLTEALSDEYRSSIKYFGGETTHTWQLFTEDIINSNKSTLNPIEVYNLTYVGVNEKIEQNKNSGNIKVADVSWLSIQGESNPMMEADYFVCSGSYLTGNFSKTKMSFLFCRSKDKAENLNNRAFLKSTGIDYISITTIEKFLDNKNFYERKIKKQATILKTTFYCFKMLVNLYNLTNNEKLECFISSGRTYLYIRRLNKKPLTNKDKQKFDKFLESLQIGLTDNVTTSRFYNPTNTGFITFDLLKLEVDFKKKSIYKANNFLSKRATKTKYDHDKVFWLEKLQKKRRV